MRIVIHCGKRVGDEEDSRRCRGSIELTDVVPVFASSQKYESLALDAQHLIDQFYDEHRHAQAPIIEIEATGQKFEPTTI